MLRSYECQIQSDQFLNLIEVCKKVKTQILVCFSTPDGLTNIYGFHETISLMKTIGDNSKKLDNVFLPIGIAMEYKHLNEMEKSIKENNIEEVSIMSIGTDDVSIDPITGAFSQFFIFSKYIKIGEQLFPLVDYNQLVQTGVRVLQEMNICEFLQYKELTNDEEFIKMIGTKSEDGASVLHIGPYVVYVAPNMLNIVAGDEASVSIHDTYGHTGKLVCFNITRKKKKCEIKVIFRIMNM